MVLWHTRIRTTSMVLYMEASRPALKAPSRQDSKNDPLQWLYSGIAASMSQVHGCNTIFAVAKADEECLKGVTKVELETLLDTVQRLHKKLGRPPNSLLLKNLPARGASEKLLTVAAEIKCDVCLENQIRASKPAVSVHREDRWWCTLQTDGLYMRFGEEVFHDLMTVDRHRVSA